MTRATLTSKGQITIPQDVREALDLKAGDKLEFETTSEGFQARVIRKPTVDELFGILQGPEPFLGLAEEQEAAALALGEDDRRIVNQAKAGKAVQKKA